MVPHASISVLGTWRQVDQEYKDSFSLKLEAVVGYIRSPLRKQTTKTGFEMMAS